MAEISIIQSFFKNTIFSYAAKIFALVMGFIYVYVVANHLGPEQYGLLSFLLDFLATGSLLLGFGAISEALVVFMPKQNSRPLAEKILLYGTVAALVFSAFVIVFPGIILGFSAKATTEIIQLIAVVVFLNLVSTLVSSILSGTKSFGKLLKLAIIENLLNVVLASVFLIYFRLGISGVIYAKAISLTSVIIAGLIYYWHVPLLKTMPDWKPVKKFVLNSAIINFLKRVSSQIILFFMSILIDPLSLGYYYIIQKMSAYIVDLPINAFNAVLLPTTSEQEDKPERIRKMISLSIKLYVPASLAFSLFLLISGPFIIQNFFPQYLPSLSLIPLFAVYFCLTFDIPLGTFYRAINRNDVLVKSNMLAIVGTVFPGYFLVSYYGLQGIIATLILTRTAQLLYQYYDIKKNNYNLEFWPRPKDLLFFWESFKTVIQAKLK